VNGCYRTDLARSSSSSVYCGLNSPDFASDNGRDKSRVDLFVSDERYIRCLDHGVGCLDHRDQTHAFNHSESFHK
jgi:hypothetical protein